MLGENPDGIYDFVNRELRKEWEAYARFEGRDPKRNLWLRTLSKRKWSLEITEVSHIKLNPDVMKYVDTERATIFSESLVIRSNELKQSVE